MPVRIMSAAAIKTAAGAGDNAGDRRSLFTSVVGKGHGFDAVIFLVPRAVNSPVMPVDRHRAS